MVDTQTGEIICTSKALEFACNFATKNDAGFSTCVNWCMSAVRGVRNTSHKNIELRIHFAEQQDSLPIPFGMTPDMAKEQAK